MEIGPDLQASCTFSVRANLIFSAVAQRPISACINQSPSGGIEETWWTVFWGPINCPVCLTIGCTSILLTFPSNWGIQSPKVWPSLTPFHLPLRYEIDAVQFITENIRKMGSLKMRWMFSSTCDKDPHDIHLRLGPNQVKGKRLVWKLNFNQSVLLPLVSNAFQITSTTEGV